MLSPAKNKAGNERKIPSFDFSLTTKPAIIRIARPKDEIIKSGEYLRPTIKPAEPNNCNIIIARPNFSKPNRLNSVFILGDLK